MLSAAGTPSFITTTSINHHDDAKVSLSFNTSPYTSECVVRISWTIAHTNYTCKEVPKL